MVDRSYVNENVVTAVRAANQIWDRRVEQLKEDIAEDEEERRRVRKLRIDNLKKAEIAAAKAKAAEMDVAREKFRKANMHIPNFQLAIDDRNGRGCQHKRRKYWAHKYGKGIRCLDCGIELTDMQDVMDAANGPLDQAVRDYHHSDLQRFYGQYSVAEVEREKFRVEKERAMVEAVDVHFYDYLHPKIIRQADQRHMLDPLDREDDVVHAPIMRQTDAAKKAAFKDGLQYFGRVRNFQARITELSDEREDLTIEKRHLNDQLSYLYGQTDFLAHRIKELGDEHDIAYVMCVHGWLAVCVVCERMCVRECARAHVSVAVDGILTWLCCLRQVCESRAAH